MCEKLLKLVGSRQSHFNNK